jgi:hypothetical protein
MDNTQPEQVLIIVMEPTLIKIPPKDAEVLLNQFGVFVTPSGFKYTKFFLTL